MRVLRDALWLQAIATAVALAGAVAGIFCVDRSRRATALGSALGAAASLGLLAVGSSLDGQPAGPPIVVTAVMGYEASVSVGLSTMGYLVCSEIYPTHVRTAGYAQAKLVTFLASFAVTMAYPYAVGAVGDPGVFSAFAGVIFLGAGLIYLFLPETAGLPLEEISRLFQSPLLRGFANGSGGRVPLAETDD